MADKSKMPENYGVYASGLTDASGTPFASIQVRRGTKDTPYFERRQVYVGDTLPQGNVTEITAEGIRVIPDEGDEYLLPVGSGSRVDYSGRKKTPDINEALELAQSIVDLNPDLAPLINQMEFDSDEDVLKDISTPLQFSGPNRVRALRNEDGSIDAEGTAAMLANPEIYKDVPEEGRQDAAQTDFMRYQSDPESMNVNFGDSYEDVDLGLTMHRFRRDDGVDVLFAETPSGQIHNLTR